MTVQYRQPFRGEYPISQGYGVTTGTDPKGHTGIDYACPEGTPILASADGTVMAAGWDNYGFGYCVILKHEDGKATLYAHLKRIDTKLSMKVKQGEQIGLSGWTGNVDPMGPAGSHLHFEARNNWWNYTSHQDPVTFLPLQSVDDTISPLPSVPLHPVIHAGVCRIACSAAYVRSWQTLQRKELLYQGDLVYVFDEAKFHEGLPFRYIGANLCIAEYDSEGTQILEAMNGNQEED